MQNPLGKTVQYKEYYDPSILFTIPRSEGRIALGLKSVDPLPFTGEDRWRAYEVSWLDSSRQPQVGILDLVFPCTNFNIIESKSLKLYLGSFVSMQFKTSQDLVSTIKNDLSSILEYGDIDLTLYQPQDWNTLHTQEIPSEWTCLDTYHDSVDSYTGEGHFYSNLLRSICPITGQPDLGTIFISFTGTVVLEEIKELIYTHRSQQAFHEQCCEYFFLEFMKYSSFDTLSVQCKYTRRGGIEICPIRSTSAKVEISSFRHVRQ